jgi:hypothetical protein
LEHKKKQRKKKDFLERLFNLKESSIFDPDYRSTFTVISRKQGGGGVLVGREDDNWLTGDNLLQKVMRSGAGKAGQSLILKTGRNVSASRSVMKVFCPKLPCVAHDTRARDIAPRSHNSGYQTLQVNISTNVEI